jgi:hypothetical protein
VNPTGTTTVSIVLEGVMHYVSLAVATTNPTVGTPITIGLTGILEDADGNLIVGTAPYAYPVTLTSTDPSNGPLPKTTLNSPADLAGIRVNYTGVNVASVTYCSRPANERSAQRNTNRRAEYLEHTARSVGASRSAKHRAEERCPPTMREVAVR